MGAITYSPQKKTSFNAAENKQVVEETGCIELMADVMSTHIYDMKICRIGCVIIVMATSVCNMS